MMKPYSTYKDSGVEWIGEVSQNWIKTKVKYLVDNSKYYQIGDGDHGSIKPEMYQEEGIPYIRVQNLSWNGELLEDGLVFISNEVHNNNLKSRLLPGDLLICKTGNTIGKIGVLTERFGESNTTSSVGKVSIDKRYNSVSFFKYVFQSDMIQRQINIIGREKSCQPGFNIDHLIDFMVIKPPLREQHQIVSFLDHKTQLIDELIGKTEQKIELLKEKRTSLINHCVTKGLNPSVEMKDSGVEWIGEIPSHWEVKRLKYLGEVYSSSVDRHIYKDELQVSVCHYPDVYNNEFINEDIKLNKGSCSEVEFERFQLKEGLVILTKDSESPDDIGIPCYVETNLRNAVCGYHLSIIKKNRNHINSKFLFRFIQSDIVRCHFEVHSKGITRFSLGKYIIENLSVNLPPLKEQQQIVQYLDEQTQKIDSVTEKETQRIELLKEYRQSLISEVVTGKIDVREEMVV